MSISGDRTGLSAPLLAGDTDNNTVVNDSKWRQWLYENIVSTKWYQIYILITILINLCIIAVDSMVATSYRFENILLLSLFTIEIILKIVTFGMIDRITPYQIPFFRHPFHIFDFLIIIISWITLFYFDITCTALRIVFIIFFIPILQMAMMVISIVKSLKNILNVLFFFLLFYIIFGIFGTYFMSGILHKRCYENTVNYDNFNTINITSSYILCYNDHDCISQSQTNNNNYTQCLSLSPNPHNGIFSFDNIFFSSLQIFIASTGHWAISMSYITECYKDSTITIYWFMLTFIYFFILLPLLLAFISDNFNDINLAKNALYLRIQKNTIFSSATANVIFYKFSTPDEDKLYYAQLTSASPRINPLLNIQKKRRKKKRLRKIKRKKKKSTLVDSIEMSTYQPSLPGDIDDDIDIESKNDIDLDDSMSLKHTNSNSKRRWSSTSMFSDASELMGISYANIRDERLIAMILRKSHNTLIMNKNELDNTSKCRKKLYALVNSIVFETIIMIL
eukprot:487513_1